MLNIEDVLESLSTPLLGIIPESEEGAPVTLRRGRGRGDGPGNSPRAFQPRWTALFNMPLRSVREADLHMWIPPTQKDMAERLRFALAICHLTLSHRQTRTGDSSFAQP
jgi:hypothetical protein